MPFLTFFAAPKPFTNPHIATIQRNAILSWLHLGEEVEVILVGDEAGIAEVAAELGVLHLPEVRCNEVNTPLVSSIFELAREIGQAPILVYLNADILVMPDFIRAARQVAAQVDRFLIIGRRWDLDVQAEIDFSERWPERLQAEVRTRGKLHPPVGSDYFVFPRDLFIDMPDFAIGRSGWDNWTIFHARNTGVAVVDITPSAMVVHQSHDYSHLPGGVPHYNLEETRRNIALGGGEKHLYTVLESDKVLKNGKVLPTKPSIVRLLRQIELRLVDEEVNGLRRLLLRRVRRLRRTITKEVLE